MKPTYGNKNPPDYMHYPALIEYADALVQLGYKAFSSRSSIFSKKHMGITFRFDLRPGWDYLTKQVCIPGLSWTWGEHALPLRVRERMISIERARLSGFIPSGRQGRQDYPVYFYEPRILAEIDKYRLGQK